MNTGFTTAEAEAATTIAARLATRNDNPELASLLALAALTVIEETRNPDVQDALRRAWKEQ